jgi:cell division septation protein DedD
VTDTEPTNDLDELDAAIADAGEADEAAVAETPEGETPAASATPAASKKDPVPDGFMTPTALANELGLRPQIVYGYIRNGKNFPQKQHTDGRFIVPVGSGNEADDARAWIKNRREATAKRKAEAAAKEKAAQEEAAAKAAEAETTPEVEVETATAD